MKWNGQYEPTGEEDLMMNIRYTDYYEAKMAKVVRVYLFNSEHLTSDQIDLKNPHPWLIVRLEDIKDTTGEVRLDMSKYDVKPAIRISLALNLRLLVRKLAAQGRVTRINAVVVIFVSKDYFLIRFRGGGKFKDSWVTTQPEGDDISDFLDEKTKIEIVKGT